MALTRDEWDALRQTVFERDLRQAWLASIEYLNSMSFARFRLAPERACVARFLDPYRSGTCFGRLTFDHVKFVLMMQKKAGDVEQQLVTVCEWHHGTNRTGGGWATTQRARDRIRDYLRRLYPEYEFPSEMTA